MFEYIFTAWIVIQAIIQTAVIPRRYEALGKTDSQIIGAIIGKSGWMWLMIAGLWYGGFYD